MKPHAITAGDLQDLIVNTLARETGNPRRWRLVVGAVKVYSETTHPHCNWSISPAGSVGEVSRVERLLDSLRLSHSIVRR